ncbi:hypothetical protein [Actinomadura alba]|uniref:Uncharacterized protein n=1 Tax=Actinomadura alba TaxID=406431 RepID=A0ABR7LXQ0_9ACTN|nr:hypothetical protein [Actinomadura alba]MBC6469541.1 hypothetical protein [Actinomadura alba]
MKCGSQIAVGVIGGYLLGRSHKTRLAVLMALMAAGGKLPVDPADLLRRTPLGAEGGPLDKLTGDLRSQLLDAGKSVAMAAASGRIDSLSDKLQQRAETLREPAAGKRRARPAEEPREERGRRADEDEDAYDYEDEYEDYYEDEEEYGPEEPEEREERRPPARLPRREPRRATRRSGQDASRAPRRTPRATR